MPYKQGLIALDVDGVLRDYGGPIGRLEIYFLHNKYYVGILSARSDIHEISKLLNLDFSYTWSAESLQKIREDYPSLKSYVYVTDNVERWSVAEQYGFLAVQPQAFTGYGDNITLLAMKVMLALIMNVANYLDYYTTKKAIEKGFKEANPVAKALMRMGWRKYQLAKWLIPIFYGAYAITSEDPYYINMAGLAIASATFIYATINNLMIIGGKERGTETPQEQAE